jgi:hypothetical protein
MTKATRKTTPPEPDNVVPIEHGRSRALYARAMAGNADAGFRARR